MATESWDNYWQNESANGEVFITESGYKNDTLNNFWLRYFTDKNNNNVLDIASGAGSIFKALPKNHQLKLHANDSSLTALKMLKDNQPDVLIYPCDIHEIPSQVKPMDIVVSQFGIEYGGESAFNLLPNILVNGGEFELITHISKGMIDSNTIKELQAIEIINSSNFLALAKKLFTDNKQSDVKSFMEIEPYLHKNLSDFNQSILNQAYFGFRKLYCNKHRYSSSDLIKWLEQLEQAKEKSSIRLKMMHNASLTEEQLAIIEKNLISQKIKYFKYKPFYITNAKQPIAWQITGRK